MEIIFIAIFLATLFLLIGINHKAFFLIVVSSIFLEHEFFWIKESEQIPFNLRPVYIATFISLLYLIPQFFLKLKKGISLKLHHKMLLSYFFYCFITLLRNPNNHSVEHFGQLSIGILLYFSFIFLSKKDHFIDIFNTLLLVGFFQLLIGLFQLIAGVLTVENIVNFSNLIQHADLVPYGRPFGTLVEPDFYGAINTFFAFIFIGEFYKSSYRIHYFAGLVNILFLMYSAVRASIIGFGISFFVLLFHFRNQIKISTIDSLLFFYSALFSIPLFYTTIIRFSYFFRSDFWIEGFNNPRVLQMSVSFSQFLENPIFGNGLNAYRFLGDRYTNIIEDWMPNWVISGYDPSIITSLLNDTGIIGFSLFTLFIYIYLKSIISRNLEQNIFVFCAILSLLISYIFTNGLPFAFTWVMLAIIEMYSTNELLKNNEL